MNTYLCKLIPPRKSFIADMTAEERAVMGAHMEYWAPLLANGTAVAMGPVADSEGSWGLGIVRAADEAALRALTANDPAITSNAGFSYHTSLMPMGAKLGATAAAKA
jgi:uncharacterized protein YciI